MAAEGNLPILYAQCCHVRIADPCRDLHIQLLSLVAHLESQLPLLLRLLSAFNLCISHLAIKQTIHLSLILLSLFFVHRTVVPAASCTTPQPRTTPPMMAASEEIRFYNEFDEQLQKCTLNTHHEACGRSYVRTHKMEAWWRGSALLRQEVTTQAARMLRYSYRSAKIETLLKPDVDDILAEGDRSFARILSILCELRLVKVIHQFRNKNLRDRDLPIEQSKLLDRFREMADAGLILVTDCEHLAHSFYQKQWKYCAEIIGADEFRDYDHDSIIPIHHKEVITDKGGTAKLWRIVVLKEFVHENLQNEAREYVPLGSKDDGQGPVSNKSSGAKDVLTICV